VGAGGWAAASGAVLVFAEVLPRPGKPLDRTFTYAVPEALIAQVRPGLQVVVPFGPRLVPGFVIALSETTQIPQPKPIAEALSSALALPPTAVPLARWMAERYLCSLGEALQPALPERTAVRLTRAVAITPAGLERIETPDARARGRPVLERLRDAGGELPLGALRRQVGRDALEGVLASLKRAGLVELRTSVEPPGAKPRRVDVVEPAQEAEALKQAAAARARRSPKQAAVLRAAAGGAPMRPADLARRCHTTSAVVRRLVREGLLALRQRDLRRVPLAAAEGASPTPPTLTLDQGLALRAILQGLKAEPSPVFLLYGVTASGKTEVFLQAVGEVVRRGRQAIVLMPEISLTAQAVGLFQARFGDRIAVLHSALSPGERYDEWRRIQGGQADVVIGARSAVFAPCPNLGLIVVDEEHETSYKQENAPRYHAREVAIQRGQLEGAGVILSSATPSLESLHHAHEGRYHLLHLPTRVDGRPFPEVSVVDLRGTGAHRAIFSARLVLALKEAMDAGDQAILFLNRRGYATFVLCPDCGRALRCPDCNVSLTYHLRGRRVLCHHCGASRPAPDVCEHCGSPEVKYSGFGTERVEAEVAKVLPQAKVGRLDRDVTAQRGAHVRVVSDFQTRRTNVLIGTQMVAKGFDFAGVTLVGVISADTALNLPDFRAGERTFQLLAQVAGRAGRRERRGRVVVQTYAPDHYAVQAAVAYDYEAFYREEIEARREHGYPPFVALARVVALAEDEEPAKALCEALAERLTGTAGLRVLGPAPAPLARLKGRYRWHLLASAANHDTLLPGLRAACDGLRAPRGVQVTVDVDPVSLM
jgi:primosomal protein N' (replication factor Y)